MQQFSEFIGILYRFLIVGLALYGIHNLVTTILFFLSKRTLKNDQPVAETSIKEWPRVTIQLPIFNEKYTLKRLLKSVTQLDYPAGCLQIQVLDDSTDDTTQLASQLVKAYRTRGINIEWIHRENRKGYKAGAMNEGLACASGDLIGIFDADFVPDPDWLRKTVPYFSRDRELGCLQTRWGHTNRKYSLLTQAESLAIDGHFIVEQTVRSRNGLFLNFNGTAGLWRRACIEDSGGWQWDTMTEDLDLSYRAQMRGWKIRYRPEVVVPAELPADVEAFKKQQSRWARGSFQVVRKLLPELVKRKDLPWYVRLIGALHLTGYIVHPLVLLLLLLSLPVGLLQPDAFKGLPISVLACFGPPLLYLTASSSLKTPWKERLKMLPVLVIVGFGISLSTSIGVIEGLTDKKVGEWVVTPKLNLSDSSRGGKKLDQTHRKPFNWLVWIEMILALYALATMIVLTPLIGWGIIPWMAFYLFGFLYIAGLNVIQSMPRLSRKLKSSKKDELDLRYIYMSKCYLKSVEELGGEPRLY
jgi:cellulose synthase/poly-beta-1,6-N-acetylglucosamine synthase-like glycosyltransferase